MLLWARQRPEEFWTSVPTYNENHAEYTPGIGFSGAGDLAGATEWIPFAVENSDLGTREVRWLPSVLVMIALFIQGIKVTLKSQGVNTTKSQFLLLQNVM